MTNIFSFGQTSKVTQVGMYFEMTGIPNSMLRRASVSQVLQLNTCGV